MRRQAPVVQLAQGPLGALPEEVKVLGVPVDGLLAGVERDVGSLAVPGDPVGDFLGAAFLLALELLPELVTVAGLVACGLTVGAASSPGAGVDADETVMLGALGVVVPELQFAEFFPLVGRQFVGFGELLLPSCGLLVGHPGGAELASPDAWHRGASFGRVDYGLRPALGWLRPQTAG